MTDAVSYLFNTLGMVVLKLVVYFKGQKRRFLKKKTHMHNKNKENNNKTTNKQITCITVRQGKFKYYEYKYKKK